MVAMTYRRRRSSEPANPGSRPTLKRVCAFRVRHSRCTCRGNDAPGAARRHLIRLDTIFGSAQRGRHVVGSSLIPQVVRTRCRPTVEALEGRDCPTVTATFALGVLTVVGDGGPNQVVVSEVGGGAVQVTGDGEQFPTFA